MRVMAGNTEGEKPLLMTGLKVVVTFLLNHSAWRVDAIPAADRHPIQLRGHLGWLKYRMQQRIWPLRPFR